MKIAILGTGGVGQAFATRFNGLGHEVTIGTRSVEQTLQRKAGQFASFNEYLEANRGVKLATFADAAAFGELIINATRGEHSIEVLESAGSINLDRKILVDIANPLDFSQGMPPSLIPGMSNTHSLGEEIQGRFPGTGVVKTLNTMWSGLMLDPSMLNNGNHVNYICGNDAGAKSKVVTLLQELGWKNECILDLGDITGARATEGILPIWLRIWGVKQTGAFNFALVI